MASIGCELCFVSKAERTTECGQPGERMGLRRTWLRTNNKAHQRQGSIDALYTNSRHSGNLHCYSLNCRCGKKDEGKTHSVSRPSGATAKLLLLFGATERLSRAMNHNSVTATCLRPRRHVDLIIETNMRFFLRGIQKIRKEKRNLKLWK